MDWVSIAHAVETASAQAADGAAGASSQLTAFAPLVVMVIIFYFLLIRPQQKKQKEHRAMLDNLQRGDTIVTQGGLQGKITGVAQDSITVEIADKVRVKIQRGYIAGIVAKADKAEAKSEASE